ncbi:MAG: anti-sigma factor family protein [Phycisphaeraceae bacterium]
MTEESRDHQVKKFLAAFADGELDIEQTIEILSRLSMDPATAARVEHQQRLREAVARVMEGPDCRDHSTRCPDALRKEIERVTVEHASDAHASSSSSSLSATSATEEDNASPHPRRTGVLATIGRWMPLAAAAALLFAAVGVYFASGVSGPDQLRYGSQASSILPASVAEKMDRRHGTCSSDTTELQHYAHYPESVRELPDAVARKMNASGRGIVPLDLSVLGYRYVQAGECVIPGKPAVHVVYRTEPAAAEDAEAMSLWITPDRGQFDAVSEGRVFMARITETHHPVMLWKRGGLVYLLLGEKLSDVESAANMLWARGRDDLLEHAETANAPRTG